MRLRATERRRARVARLARKVDRLDQLEPKSLITDPINLAGVSVGLPVLWGIFGSPRSDGPSVNRGQFGSLPAQSGSAGPGSRSGMAEDQALSRALGGPMPALRIVPAAAGGGSAAPDSALTKSPLPVSDWLDVDAEVPVDPAPVLSGLTAPASSPVKGGGQPIAARGGSGGGVLPATLALVQGQVSPLRVPSPPGATSTGPLMLAPNNASGSAGASTGLSIRTPAPSSGAAQAAARPSAPQPAGQTGPVTPKPGFAHMNAGGGGPSTVDPSSITDPTTGNSSPAAQMSFPFYPVYTLDYFDGSVLMPGAYQLATLGGNVDLRAQVRDTTVSSFTWDTSHLHASAITGASTYHLTFRWATTVTVAEDDPVTLTVSDINSNIETFTYDFHLPIGATSYNGGATTWPASLPPSQVLEQAPALDSHNVSVDATSGALDAGIALPSYNPQLPALVLTYNSVTADPRPIVVVPHTLDDSQAVPTKVSGQITVKDTGGTTKYTGTTWYYDTSQFIAGDVQQIGLQSDMTSVSTGRYNYTATVIDYRTVNTTTTITGTMSVINQSASVFGGGWELQGLEKITSASGGVILGLGDGGDSLWFSGSFGAGGGTYTDQAGEFSALVLNANGTYARTLTDGTQITFDSSGNETATIDTNGLHVTFSYSGGNLQTITDPYSKVVTFTYSGGYLQTIKDPASGITTFTHTGASLTGVTLPDSSTWGYSYDGAGRLTQSTDGNSKTVSVAYDSSERASTITRPDSTTETFVADQERGWTNSGTSGSPAAATLLAEARSTYTDPDGNVTDLRPDWNGQGLTNVDVDALGNVATYDRDSNGLSTIAVDRLNRIEQRVFDNKGNTTQHIYADLNSEYDSYNSFSEVTKYTDASNNVTSYTYDSGGNLTIAQDALSNLTTMTYTGDGMLATIKDSDKHTTSYQYDSQDRLTTVTNADSSTVLYGYDSQGDVTSTTDELGHTTTYSFDAMNRETGTTDALSNKVTYTFDSGGRATVLQLPTPAGQTARTTTISYDAMNRPVTITAPLSRVTALGYDSAGNLTKVTDPLGRVTSIAYNALNRPTVVTTPLTGSTNAVTTTVYDAEGQVTRVIDPLGRVTTTTFDNSGWVATVVDPLNNATSTYSYTHTGQMAGVTDPSNSGGTLYSYLYDADNRVVTATDALGNNTIYGYDGVGNVVTVKDPNNNITIYAYDVRNRPTTVTDALGHSAVYGFDSGGNQQTVKDALGNVTTTAYDALNRATTVTDSRGGVTTMAFDAASRMTGLTDPNGNHTSWGYDAADRTTTMTDPLGHSATYVYNADNELTDTTDRNGRRVT
ncbi:MAG: hypothetical protein ACHRXM_32095, partial [Isosphaerales bacterium]